MNKYKKSGWFNESQRHSLARRGIRTGRKINYAWTKAHGYEYIKNPRTEYMARLFFIKRFGRDPSHPAEKAYFDEWRHRFYTGHPETYMDSESLNVYKKIIEGDTKLPKNWKGKGGITVKVVPYNKLKKINYYKISSISDKSKLNQLVEDIRRRLDERGFTAYFTVKNGAIQLSDIRISQQRIDKLGHNIQYSPYTKSGERRTRALSWDDWVDVNDAVNDVLDDAGVSANVKSLGGKFDIRDKYSGRRTEQDWEHLATENVGSVMEPVTREGHITRPEKRIDMAKYDVKAIAMNRRTREQIGSSRIERIDTDKNVLFKGLKDSSDIEKRYESFWNDMNPNSSEIVKVINVKKVKK